MAMWQRGGNYFHHRLSKLYSDTKQSYEEAKVVPTASPSIEDDPNVIALRKEFTIQQDRLLAWGMHWADVGVHAASSYLTKGQDVNIDKKIDQAGLGDVVASVMEEIKRLLDESGKLQHPERYEMARKPSSPRIQRKEWNDHEVHTGRVLLDQLKSCIDVLYSLVEGQDQGAEVSTKGQSKGRNKSISVDEAFGTANEDPTAALVFSHPLYIDFASLAPMHDPDASAEPPSYDDAQDSSGIKSRSIYFYPTAQAHVVVDLVSTRAISTDREQSSPLYQLYNLSDKLSGGGLLSWDGHLKLLGFTVASASSRFGLVYKLPAPVDQTAIQQYQTLSTTIAASCDHDTSIPALENKFRLAYNIALLTAGYLARNSTHGYINSLNVLFLRENENSRQLGSTVRHPYLLQPIKKIAGVPTTGETQQDSMYHHPDADGAGYGAVAAYDIYSLGLVLLELGLWMPLRKFWKQKYDRQAFSERLRRIYSPKLASKCGSRFMKAVQKCLDAPTALVDKSSTIDAAEYLLQIVRDLAHCCAIDEVDQPSGLDIEIFEALIDEQKVSMPPPDKQIRRKPVASSASLAALAAPNKDSMAVRSGPRPRQRRKHLPGAGHSSPDNTGLRQFPEIPIPQQHLNEWNTLLMPKLSKILNLALKGSDESASCSLMMLGPSPEQAKTTICIQCTNTTGVRDMLCKRFKPKRGWGVIIMKGEIHRSGRYRTSGQKSRKVRRSNGSPNSESADVKTKQQEYQKRPGPGASIGAFKDGEHLPPVSFGGTILVDGEVYGMTVHHMLDDPSDQSDSDQEDNNSDDEELEGQLMDNVRRSMAPRQHDEQWHRGLHEASKQLGFDDQSFSPEALDEDEEIEFEDYESDSDTSTIRPDYSIMDEDGTEHWFLDDSDAPELDDDYPSSEDEDEDDDDTASVGDVPGVQPWTMDDDDLCVTQPAIDDVDEDFFPSAEDRDDDHLASHAFGHVHASSGIKRAIAGGLKHEVDWALIRVNEDRQHRQAARANRRSKTRPVSSRSSTSSSTRSNANTASEPHLTSITPLGSLPNTKVTCIARTSGPSQGRISPALCLVKFHGRTTVSASFTVEGGFGLPGDSGAWIWSEERNELCGHVLAYSQALRQAYMAPMEVLIDDMKRALNADTIELPAEAMAKTAANAVEQRKKGKAVFEVVEGQGSSTSHGLNKDLDRAREVEVALAGLRLDSQQSFGPSGFPPPARYQTNTTTTTPHIQRIDVQYPPSPKSPITDKTSSTMTSKHSGTSSATTSSQEQRTKKERFDIHLRGGAGDLHSLPMARALS